MQDLAPHEKPCQHCGQIAGHHSASCVHSGTERYGALAPHFKTQGDVERRPMEAVAEPDLPVAEPVPEMIADAGTKKKKAAK